MLPGQFVQQRWGQHAALLGGILHSNFCFVRAALFAVQSKRENKARVPARRLLHSLTKRGPRGRNLSWASRLSLTNIYNRLSAGQSFAWCRRRRQRCELRSHFVVAHLWCLGKLPLSLLSLCVYHRYKSTSLRRGAKWQASGISITPPARALARDIVILEFFLLVFLA